MVEQRKMHGLILAHSLIQSHKGESVVEIPQRRTEGQEKRIKTRGKKETGTSKEQNRCKII
jgi:hypothetical protein